MPKRKIGIPCLDLHHISHEGYNHRDIVFQEIDSFLRMHSSQHQTLEIITGRGLHSKKSIGGMHPTLHYTIEYLTLVGYEYLAKRDRGICIVYT